jgi:hypothetical protein
MPAADQRQLIPGVSTTVGSPEDRRFIRAEVAADFAPRQDIAIGEERPTLHAIDVRENLRIEEAPHQRRTSFVHDDRVVVEVSSKVDARPVDCVLNVIAHDDQYPILPAQAKYVIDFSDSLIDPAIGVDRFLGAWAVDM